MLDRVEDVTEAFLDLVFKFSLLGNEGSVKDAFAESLRNNIAEINLHQILASVSALGEIFQEVTSSVRSALKSCSEESGSCVMNLKNNTKQVKKCNMSDVTSSFQQSNDVIDSQFVQITADSDEVNRRIAAFIERQQIQVNLANIQEFCGVEHNADDSCARVDAVFSRRAGSKSHILVRRVVNNCGPQTRDPCMGPTELVSAPSRTCGSRFQGDESFPINSALEERLGNMETHLKMYAGGPVPKDVYVRLQQLENRVLHLESLSPEYFEDAKMNAFGPT